MTEPSQSQHTCQLQALVLLSACAAMVGAAQAQAPVAQPSNVQIYGLVDAYIGSMRRSDQTGRTSVLNSNGMTTAYWGVRGTEDLGGGLKAQFALESFFQTDTGTPGRNATDPFFSRNAWVGVTGGFGQLAAGRQTNPLFVASGAFNPFGGSLQFSPVMLHTWQVTYNRAVLGDSVWNNTIQYVSPTVSGFKANVIYGFGEVPGDSGTHNLNITVNYAGGPVAAVLSVQEAETGVGFDATVKRQTAFLAGASYDFGSVKAFGQWQRARTPARRMEADTLQLGMSVPVGSGQIMASAATTERDITATAITRRTSWAVGYNHAVSKRTDLYAVYLRDKLTGFGASGSVGMGIRHRF